MGPGRDDEARLADPVGLELLDDHAVKQRTQLLAHAPRVERPRRPGAFALTGGRRDPPDG